MSLLDTRLNRSHSRKIEMNIQSSASLHPGKELAPVSCETPSLCLSADLYTYNYGCQSNCRLLLMSQRLVASEGRDLTKRIFWIKKILASREDLGVMWP